MFFKVIKRNNTPLKSGFKRLSGLYADFKFVNCIGGYKLPYKCAFTQAKYAKGPK